MSLAYDCGHFLDPDADRILGRMAGSRRALFLDRDGVINSDSGYVNTPGRTQWVPGIFDLVRRAHEGGYLPIVITNQAGIARGYYTEADFRAFTAWIHEEFSRHATPLLATYFCPHHPTEGLGQYLKNCECRKPRPGMILAAANRFNVDVAGSVIVGDKVSDAAAGIAAGVGTGVLVQQDGLLHSINHLRVLCAD